ncbi:hypothetical protein H5203_17440 [Pseudoalteromonas sp. SG41-1]|uniref:hypothetical protein n=1 Tax=Pseudoalteromonas sp. SG41-1 TaxID=2760979 RepID=UPI0015FF8658|nr:hypothetical protein [Pseudoalteromonas sp. SG41-1]MBB1507265.1 hypothetical protein [Pseudoalteromonas sp. SG41-1]
MQKIIEFKKQRGFFRGGIDIDALNERIYQLNQDGWKVINVSASAGLYGQVYAYILLIENEEL